MDKRGFTLIELLVALAVLSVVLFIAYGGIIDFMRTRSDQDAIVDVQQKLRRVLEVFTQDLRSNVLGAISDEPYESGTGQISFMLINGAAGYLVLPHDSGNNTSFKQAAEVKFITSHQPNFGRYALMVNQNGVAVILPVTRVNTVNNPRWHLVHAGCGNTIDYTPNTLLFEISVVGFRYDPDTQELIAYKDGTEEPLAFNISDFRIDYVYYDDSTSSDVINPSGYNPANAPPRKRFSTYTLRRLQVTLEAFATSRGRRFSRRYVGAVELPQNRTFTINEVVECQ